MAIHVRYSLIIAVTLACLSCNRKSVEPDANDRGGYWLQATPTSVQSYRGGGGIFILCMTPSKSFAGKVLVSVVADPVLHAQISPEFLTLDKQVAEVTIRPDTTAALESHTISIIHTHADVSDTLNLEVEIIDWEASLGLDYAISKQDEFVTWIQARYPELGIEIGQDWFAYSSKPGVVGGSTWTYLNSTWDMTVRWPVIPSPPFELLLRKRGEAEPAFAAKMEPDGMIHQIPVSEF